MCLANGWIFGLAPSVQRDIICILPPDQETSEHPIRNYSVKVLFVCVHNSGRSQMAEAFTRTLSGGMVDAHSAGTMPSDGLNPVVAGVMDERGIPLAGYYPKVIDQQMVDDADYAFTMGCAIDDACPAVFVPSEDWGLEDPAGQPIDKVREIRDEVEVRVRAMLADMGIDAAE